MNKALALIISALAVLPLTINLAFAGSTEATQAILAPEKIMRFAKDVEKYAAKKGARAFIIGRVGRPAKDLPKGIAFTHTAIALYSSIKLADGKTANGYAIHNLYQNAEQLDQSALIVDYPVDFFWGVNQLKAGIIIPTAELQQRIMTTIASGNNKTLHNSNYSVIANPFTSQFQNCTEHTLDIVNSSIYQTTDSGKLKRNAQAHFKAQRVHTSPFKIMLGSMVMDDVTTKDHNGKVYTATFTTIASYLTANHLIDEAVVFTEDGQVNPLL
ncbi:DUF2145 domain-containing protein [Colwelliaceae bacterium MEBiC 14330]